MRVTRSIMIVKPPQLNQKDSPPVSPAGSTPPVSPFAGKVRNKSYLINYCYCVVSIRKKIIHIAFSTRRIFGIWERVI